LIDPHYKPVHTASSNPSGKLFFHSRMIALLQVVYLDVGAQNALTSVLSDFSLYRSAPNKEADYAPY